MGSRHLSWTSASTRRSGADPARHYRREPANLIVLGNRALGTDEGRPLGAVPGSAVRDVVGDVLERQRPLTDVTGADR
jgi:hypothetical protein